MTITREEMEKILKKVFGREFPMKNSNFWDRVSSTLQAELAEQAGEIERLEAIEVAARALCHVAACNVQTLAKRGYDDSSAFRAAGDQWHAAYSELKTALAAAEAAKGEK